MHYSFFQQSLWARIMFARWLAGSLLGLSLCLTAWAADPDLSDPALEACIAQLMQEQGWSSVDEVTEVKCHNSGIGSLAGIQKFTGLKILSLYNNSLSEAELSALPELQHLNLARNQLRSMGLKDLPKLEELYLFRNNLKQLQLVALPALTQLRANSNRLETFQYQQLPALEKIYLFDNELEHIDIYNLPALKYMDVRENPMPDKLYEEMDNMSRATILHDGNADDW